MTDVIAHRDLAISRLATQFSEASNLINYIRSLLRESDDMETMLQDLLDNRYIDTAVGIQLDILGEIVGQDREFSQTVNGTFFGFKGSIGGDTFGTTGTAGTGSNFKSESDIEFIDAIFSDTTYRIFIRSKISKNKTKITIDEIVDIVLQGVSSAATVTVTETQAAFKLTFPGVLSGDDKLLLARTTYTPRPIGISVAYADDDGLFI